MVGAVRLGVSLQCGACVASCISSNCLISILQSASAFSHCSLDNCLSGSGAFGWAASPPQVIWKIRQSTCAFIALTKKCLFLRAFSFDTTSSCCIRVMSPRPSAFGASFATPALIYDTTLSSTIRMLSPENSTLST